ncbi:PRA1 family protein H isoform X2 [Amborella trichopoda]|uniref:PRA1 family protein H isoform X2 n=1 Tax=Amborella trichopoda TaxID=13333 RepID=UPI0005D3F029|nr:PRA1 family protein H isoform X2 [Amborella trichopoda]|eukprot:XP_011627347.1 PRA1 family protein H isoform X2 [Amborella trichopoda]
MAFSANPLSLSVPEAAFETWLQETGYLETLDTRNIPPCVDRCTTSTGGATSFFSLFAFNPFSKLTVEDLKRQPASWTGEFFDCGLGPSRTYSLPSSVSQARLRIQENIRRYPRNYAYLSLLILCCFLYKIPIALFGLVSTVALWEVLRICSNRWQLEKYPVILHVMVLLMQLCFTFPVSYYKMLYSQ